MDEDTAAAEAIRVFEREIGATGVKTEITLAGNQPFLKFTVGREAPIYTRALRETQRALSPQNPFRGALGLKYHSTQRFPKSLEATALRTLLTKSTRLIASDMSERGFSVPYVPFQNHEDHQLAQCATHVVVGRRGVGKSTLIRCAVQILEIRRHWLLSLMSKLILLYRVAISPERNSSRCFESINGGCFQKSRKS